MHQDLHQNLHMYVFQSKFTHFNLVPSHGSTSQSRPTLTEGKYRQWLKWQNTSSPCRPPIPPSLSELQGGSKKSKLLTQYNSLLFFEPPCRPLGKCHCTSSLKDMSQVKNQPPMI